MISFAVTTKNEGRYIQELLSQLVPFCAETGDEIVVLDDFSTDEETLNILKSIMENILAGFVEQSTGFLPRLSAVLHIPN